MSRTHRCPKRTTAVLKTGGSLDPRRFLATSIRPALASSMRIGFPSDPTVAVPAVSLTQQIKGGGCASKLAPGTPPSPLRGSKSSVMRSDASPSTPSSKMYPSSPSPPAPTRESRPQVGSRAARVERAARNADAISALSWIVPSPGAALVQSSPARARPEACTWETPFICSPEGRSVPVRGAQVSEPPTPGRVALNLVIALPLRLHAFTSETTARGILYRPGENSAAPPARLRLGKPLLLTPGDRFVLQKSLGEETAR